jgi:transcriptional regulator with XRE-family HTH domain
MTAFCIIVTPTAPIVNSSYTPIIGLPYDCDMPKLIPTLAKLVSEEEQALRGLLSVNVKKYRRRRAWSQFTLAAKIDMSTNFLADLEAGNTWVSALTLVKLAKAFDIEAYELLKPEEFGEIQKEKERVMSLIDQFSTDLTVVLKDSIEKAIKHVKKEYSK